jgi:hypothetical protein
MIFVLPQELLQHILDSTDYLAQIRLTLTCNKFKLLKITNMYVPNSLTSQLSENILLRYTDIQKLNLYDNTLTKDISYLKHLTHLNISGACQINQEQIDKQVKLKQLIMNNNPHVTMIRHLTKLEDLSVMGCCRMSEIEINLLSLKSLRIDFNCELHKENLLFYRIQQV